LGRLTPSIVRERLQGSFWLLPSLAMLAGIILGLGLPSLDTLAEGSIGPFQTSESGSALSILEVIATVTVSVAGISFSVTVVALQLASSQLGPRVLRTFQTNRLSQATLGVFLGIFVFALVALARIDPAADPPNLTLTFAVLASVIALSGGHRWGSASRDGGAKPDRVHACRPLANCDSRRPLGLSPGGRRRGAPDGRTRLRLRRRTAHPARRLRRARHGARAGNVPGRRHRPSCRCRACHFSSRRGADARPRRWLSHSPARRRRPSGSFSEPQRSNHG